MEKKYLEENTHGKTFSFSMLFKEAVFRDFVFSLNITVKSSVKRPKSNSKNSKIIKLIIHRLQRQKKKKKEKAQAYGSKQTSGKNSASEGTLRTRCRSPWDLYCILLDVYVAHELKTLFYKWSFHFFSSGKYYANGLFT